MTGDRSVLAGQRVIVLSDAVGEMGGAAKATMLLCEALSTAGAAVSLFVTTAPSKSTSNKLRSSGVSVVAPFVTRGWRLGMPSRSLALRAWIAMRRYPEAILHSVGLTNELMHFLRFPGQFRVMAWETTEARPYNKFVPRGMTPLLRKLHVLLVPSRTIETNARSTYGFGGRTAILPFWVEDRSGTTLPALAPRRKFLFVGRMDPDKGFRFLIPAFEKIRQEFAGTELELCGSGDPSTIPELRDPPAGVTARGAVSEEKLTNALDESFAVILPSLHEGYPLSLLQGCSFGKPVIATTVGSIPEVFAGRTGALLVPPADADALYSAMQKLLGEDMQAHHARRVDSRRIFEEVCSPAAVLGALEAAYSLA